MYHINNCFLRWHSASGSRKVTCSRVAIVYRCKTPIKSIYGFWTSVAYRDVENGSQPIGQGLVYMPHKRLWGIFNVPFSINHCLDDEFWSSFDLQCLKLWILLTGHTSMAYHKWEWKIDHWLIELNWHSLPSSRLPSTIACLRGKHATWGSRQSLVQEAGHDVNAIWDTVTMLLIIHAQIYFIILKQIVILHGQSYKSNWLTICAAWLVEVSTQLVMTLRPPNLTMIRAPLVKTSLITSWRNWWSTPTILLIVSAAWLLLLMLACDSQLGCLSAGLPSPAAASPSPAVTATATAMSSPRSPALRIRD